MRSRPTCIAHTTPKHTVRTTLLLLTGDKEPDLLDAVKQNTVLRDAGQLAVLTAPPPMSVCSLHTCQLVILLPLTAVDFTARRAPYQQLLWTGLPFVLTASLYCTQRPLVFHLRMFSFKFPECKKCSKER